MMKQKLLLMVMLVAITAVSAQANLLTPEQVQNLPDHKRALYESILQADLNREQQVQQYLTNNPQATRVISENGVQLVLYKVENNQPLYRALDSNFDAARATGTDHLQVGGSLGLNLDGSGITVGVWDGGPVQATHTEFQDQTGVNSRIINVENTNTSGGTSQDTHGTHVTGTIAARGVNAQARGMATAVTVRTYNFNNDASEISAALALPDPIFLSNHSYGVPISQGGGTIDAWRMGAYDSDARQMDQIARDNDMWLMVTSAGNGGQVNYSGGLLAGFDKLTTDKNAKNNLVIANAAPSINPFGAPPTLNINPGSSEGPTDDLRIKPDIAGDGTALFSTAPNDGYTTLSGTSMSSPNVMGSLVLLQQYYEQLNGNYMKAATLKGLVIHTALDDANQAGPDPIFGWGLLDAEKSAIALTDASNGAAIVDELTLVNNVPYTRTISAQAGERLSATISWTDVAGQATNGVLNDPTPKLVNDLDIRITKDGTTYLPYKLEFNPGVGFSAVQGDNSVDNVERIDIDVPDTGIYTITVTHKGTLATSIPFAPREQDFALILTGNNVTLSTAENTLAESLSIFPNPNNGTFNLIFNTTSNADVTVDIFDISGRKVFNNIYSNVNQQFNKVLELNNVRTGLYLVNITQAGNTTTKKLVIK